MKNCFDDLTIDSREGYEDQNPDRSVEDNDMGFALSMLGQCTWNEKQVVRKTVVQALSMHSPDYN